VRYEVKLISLYKKAPNRKVSVYMEADNRVDAFNKARKIIRTMGFEYVVLGIEKVGEDK